MVQDEELLLDIVAYDDSGTEVHPFVGVRGNKHGKFSANLDNENRENFFAYTEAQLRGLVEAGAFRERGRIRMLPRGARLRSGAGAYAPVLYKGMPIKM